MTSMATTQLDPPIAWNDPRIETPPRLDHQWFILDIPRPPSVNRFLNRLGNKSPVVAKWRAQADQYLRAAGRYPRLIGPYELLVVYPLGQFTSFDGENCQKALSDWLQRVEIVQNDRMARRLVIDWGDAPAGCRVHVRPWMEAA